MPRIRKPSPKPACVARSGFLSRGTVFKSASTRYAHFPVVALPKNRASLARRANRSRGRMSSALLKAVAPSSTRQGFATVAPNNTRDADDESDSTSVPGVRASSLARRCRDAPSLSGKTSAASARLSAAASPRFECGPLGTKSVQGSPQG